MIKLLPCELSKDEVAKREHDLFATIEELDALNEKHKGERKPLKARIESIRKQLREGSEVRAIECEERHDERTGRVMVVRLDTEEVIDERAMTVNERQVGIFDDDGNEIDDDAPDSEDGEG